ncbi:MAG: conjugal transfer protein TrbF [Lachnospiraceae bacterium]|nr:conjugal transfer protein TrbF [Lachnospiraceae bacterium]
MSEKLEMTPKESKKRGGRDPWATARMEWNAHEGSIISSRRMWQLISFFMGFITLVAICGIVFIGSQSKYIPYIVAVDKLGNAIAVKRADLASPVDKRIVMATLASFIHDLRFVSPDFTVQKRAVFNVYAYLSPTNPATIKIDEFYKNEATNPFERSDTETVNVIITSVVQQSQETWQIYWTEEVRDRKGPKKSVQKYRANATIYIAPATTTRTDEDIQKNPLGIFIRDIFWGTQL